ncbi:Ig-like domain-containing protein [Rubellicoccus peritrichatus]|uniref:Ig-like domain-containing protein n=1 Tax=Rubellicoccus peritrichatus TaxID=3080537 RepID=A0AAQ3QUV5_9BACT|nr:Ig-like domain-containing protein [Puniceicoccus sp. CR14]WOO40320.1 Ig-like domain-containing protein [Puniceicoccus sp. CR14]
MILNPLSPIVKSASYHYNQQLISFGEALRLLFVLAIMLFCFVCSIRAEVLFAVNCGGNAYVSTDGTQFVADSYSNGGSLTSLSGDIGGTLDDELHARYRWSSTSFSYDFPVPNGDYVVDLYFADALNLGSRVFDVNIEDSLVLDDYDIRAQVPDKRIEVIESLPVTVTDGELNVSVIKGLAGNGKLSAIRVQTVAAEGPVHPVLPLENLVLLDEINCGDVNDPHPFEEYPVGVSEIQNILGVPTRVLPNPIGGDVRYFAYRIGANLGLEAGKAYLLQVDYPEDSSRTIYVTNAGGSMTRGFHIGKSVGDALDAPYVYPSPESLDIPLSGEIKTWQNLFYLHDRFTGIVRNRTEGSYPDLPADGFMVVISQFANHELPMSNGAAVSSIRLYEVTDEAAFTLPLNLPPKELPRRHTFYREEMADGVVWSYDPEQRSLLNTIDWYENKAKRQKFLGMNTYALNLLEFGSNQGFDSGYGGGNDWYYLARDPERLENVLDMLGGYDLDFLPYYEYAGSRGADSLGHQKRARPLQENQTVYTQISWSEISRADITDPETIADAKLLLDATISRYKDKVNIIGAWFRARVSQMPISFNEANFAAFAEDMNNGIPISRQQIIDSDALYENYKQWWFGKRRDFINEMRDHLRAQGVNPEASILFTSDAKETGKADVPPGQEDLVAEDVAAWNALGYPATSLQEALDTDRHYRALTIPRDTWGSWEWHHADVENDPYNYSSNEGGMLTYSYNRNFTVSDVESLQAFNTTSGLAMVRHFSLNEDAMTLDLGGPNEDAVMGYFVADCEYAGPFVMMKEALAFANGDPRYLGYLCSWRYNPGFPAYVRAFNQAFLALPALPSSKLIGASSEPEVVVRSIETEGYGTYLGVVNTARNDVSVTVALPERGVVYDAATGQIVHSNTDAISLEMYPNQLRSFRIDKQTLDGAVAVDDFVTLNEGGTVDVDVTSNDSGPGSLSLVSVGQARNGTATIEGTSIRYTPDTGFYGEDSVAYTLTNGTDNDIARIYFTVNDTSIANGFDHWGLSSNLVGNFVTGNSRLLADGLTGELRGSGLGFQGAEDSAYFESQSVLGDFTLTAHFSDFSQLGDGAAGIMIRQGLVPNSRFVALGLDSAGNVIFSSRKSSDYASTGGSDNIVSGGWVRLVRTGTVIEMQVSSDSMNYVTVGRRVLPGLPVKLDVGIFLYGGDVNAPVYGFVQDFSISNQSLASNVLFAQSFSDGSNLQTYFDISPSQNQFSEIVAEADGGMWSIVEGALEIIRTGVDSSDDGAGFARFVDFSGPPSVMKFSFDFGVSGSSTNGTMVTITHGDFDSVSDYNSGGASASKFNQFTIKGQGVGLYHFPFGSAKYGQSLANGDMSNIVVFLNDSGQTQTYEGPDGNIYLIENLKSSYWLNGEVILENFERSQNYDASGIKTFRVNVYANDFSRIRFDNFVVENTFPIVPDTVTNLGPTAVDDFISIDEGMTLIIDPLSNDNDSDNGPDGLTVISFNQPANGTVEQVGNKLHYTPTPGYFGSDTFDYTLSDGLNTDTATVNVTINDTSLASDLTSVGLNGSTIGGASGYSRLFEDNHLEVSSSGVGLGGVADAIHYEQMSYSGNFILEARIVDLTSTDGSSARGGLMIREDLEDDARMAVLTTGTDAQYRYGSRIAIGGIVSELDSGISFAYPGAWIRIVRVEDEITFLVSSDGLNFTSIDTVTINGLKETVHLGLFAAASRMTATDFLLLPEQEALLEQDFSESTVVADYFDGITPTRNQFTDIGTESDGGTWSIDNGSLKLTRPGIDSNENGAGFYRLADLAGPPNILKASFDVALENTSLYLDVAALELGSWSTHADYNSNGSTSAYANSLVFKAAGEGLFRFRLNGQNSVTFPADGTPVSVVWYVNTSGQSLVYTGLDGLPHTLDHECSSVWGNGVLLHDNVLRPTPYNIDDIVNFRLRCETRLPITIAFDNLVIDDSFLVNEPPVAVNDSVETDENTPVSIDVLSNDTDSDAQPSPLAIYSVSQPRHGSLSVVGTNVLYTPDSGFSGMDEFTYLVTDGAEQDWGLVSILVGSDTLFETLSSEGLTGQTIGTGSDGSSRVLISEEWEVIGSGNGFTGVSDSFHFEESSVEGDFSLYARVKNLNSSASTPRAGVMIRESNNPDARMVALATSNGTAYSVIKRLVNASASSESIMTGFYSYPDAWLMLERVGDIINIAVSNDGQAYSQVDSINLVGLSPTVQAGIFSSSGDIGVDADATFEDFELTLSPALFTQDFNSSTIVADYFDATNPSANQMNDISAEVNGGTWSITNGTLQLERNGGSGSDAASGFMRYTDFPDSPSVLKIEFDLTVANTTTYSDMAGLRIGEFSSQRDYSNSMPSVLTAFDLAIKGAGNGYYRFRINSTNTTSYAEDGSFVHVVWYLNASGTTQSYIGPDGGSYTLDDGCSSLWGGTILLLGNEPRNQNFGSSILTDLYFRSTTSQSAVFQFDNITISKSL